MWVEVGVVLIIAAFVVVVRTWMKRRDGPGPVTNVKVSMSDD